MKIFYLLMYLATAAFFYYSTRNLLRYGHDLDQQGSSVYNFWMTWLPKSQNNLKMMINALVIIFAIILFILSVNIIFKFLEILAFMI